MLAVASEWQLAMLCFDLSALTGCQRRERAERRAAPAKYIVASKRRPNYAAKMAGRPCAKLVAVMPSRIA